MNSVKIDLTAIDHIIREIGVSQIMPRFRKLAAGDVHMKGKDDPVTIADQEAERHLTERFVSYLPGSVVVGEEAVAKDKSVLDLLTRDTPVWIIDPIDGTRNFVSGSAEFATMVALCVNKQPIASWIHDPNSGDTIMAEKGGGVWLRGKKLKLAAHDPKLPPLGLVGARVKKLVSDPNIFPESAEMPTIEIGSCAGFDYPRLFAGEVTYADRATARASFLLYRHTNAWDHVPGYFMQQEAGGYCANWSKEPYDMTNPLAGLLYARDKDEWARLYRLFGPLITYVVKKTA